MAGQDEQLRLAAQVLNNFSGPIRDMQRSLRSLAAETKGVHKQGKEQAETHTKAIKELRGAFGGVTKDLKELVSPAFVAFGITGLSAAGAIAGITEAVRAMGREIPALQWLSRETSVSIDKIQQYSALASRVGSSSGAMQAGLLAFDAHMERLQRAAPQELAAWQQLGPEVYRFGESLRGLSRNAQLDAVMNAMERITGMDQRRRFLQFLGLPAELANLNARELSKAMAELKKEFRPLTQEQIARTMALREANNRLSESFELLKQDVGVELAPAFAQVADSIRQFVNANKGELIATLNDLSGWIKSGGVERLGSEIKTVAINVNDVVKEFGGWKNVAEVLIALKLAGWVGQVATSLVALRVAVIPVTAALSALSAPAVSIFAGMSAGAVEAYAGWAHWGEIIDAVAQKLGVAQSKVETFVKFMAGIPLVGMPFAAFTAGHEAHQAAPWLMKPGFGLPGAAAAHDWLHSWFGRTPQTAGPADTGAIEPLTLRGIQERLGLKDTAPISALPSMPAPGLAPEDSKDAVEKGTHQGIVQGLREWFNQYAGGALGFAAGAGGLPAALTAAGNAIRVPRSSAAPGAGGAGVPTVAPGGVGLSSRERVSAATIMSGLQARGFTREQAAAVVGNLTAESSLKPGIVNSIGAMGLEQLLGARKRGFLNFAHATGRDWRDVNAQLDWLKMERSGESVRYGGTNESRAYAKAFGAGDVAHMAAAFGASVERPSMMELRGSLRRREQAAIEAYRLNEKISDGSLHRAAKNAGVNGGTQTINGAAKLRIDLNNFPRGTKTSYQDDGLFKQVTLNRGLSMTLASEEG